MRSSPVSRLSPVARHSPVTVTTTSRYESTTKNVHSSSPRHFSSSPSPRRETTPPTANYITQSTHRIASPITVTTTNRISSPLTTSSITHQRISSPGGKVFVFIHRYKRKIKVSATIFLISGFSSKTSNNQSVNLFSRTVFKEIKFYNIANYL